MRKVTSVTLEKIKRYPTLKRHLEGMTVLIYSGEAGAWWSPKASGYAVKVREAGVYLFAEAWQRTSHCGPEKGIVYHLAAGLVEQSQATEPGTFGEWLTKH